MNEQATGFDDLFGSIDFPDAKISLEGDPGQKSDSPPDKGQESDSPTDGQKDDDLKQDPPEKKESNEDDPEGKEDGEADTPFDKNPKWIKARAAEKAVQEIMDEYGLLDMDEVKEALMAGKSLKEAMAGQDLDALKKDSKAYQEYKRRMENEPDPDADPDQVPDEKLAQALQQVKDLTTELQGIKDKASREEADEKAFENYSSDVDKILEISEDISLDETETTMFKSLMGIDNPSTQVDIDNRAEVRTMVKNSVKQFAASLQEIKQKAIDDFAAGKSEMVVTDPKKSADSDSPIIDKKNYDPEKQSVDEVLDSGKDELFDLINQTAKQVF
jgi:hypothetical protein